jgi:hypothetical protein
VHLLEQRHWIVNWKLLVQDVAKGCFILQSSGERIIAICPLDLHTRGQPSMDDGL